MKKMILATLLFSPILAITTIANADPIDSDATVNILAGSGSVDPEDPNNPTNPGDGGATGQNGPLSLDQVIVFAFDDMNLSGNTQSIDLKADGPKNVQITDNRGTGEGWSLQVKQSELVDTTDAQKTLKGAYITLKNGVVTRGNGVESSVPAPTFDQYDVSYLNKTDYKKIVTSGVNAGLGTWKIFFNQENKQDIQLVVPSGNLIGNYAGTVTWLLSDSPNPQ